MLKKLFLVKVFVICMVTSVPTKHEDILQKIIITLFGILILNATKTDDVEFYKEAKTMIVVNLWLNSLKRTILCTVKLYKKPKKLTYLENETI